MRILVKKSHGLRIKSRRIMKKKVREKGMPMANMVLQEFEIGEKVIIKIDSAVPKGMPYKRFQGREGEVQGKQGKCFVLKIKDGNKEKKVMTNPVHIKALR